MCLLFGLWLDKEKSEIRHLYIKRNKETTIMHLDIMEMRWQDRKMCIQRCGNTCETFWGNEYLLHVGFGSVEVLICFLCILSSLFCFSPLPFKSFFTLPTKKREKKKIKTIHDGYYLHNALI